jgi:hypothetical protein
MDMPTLHIPLYCGNRFRLYISSVWIISEISFYFSVLHFNLYSLCFRPPYDSFVSTSQPITYCRLSSLLRIKCNQQHLMYTFSNKFWQNPFTCFGNKIWMEGYHLLVIHSLYALLQHMIGKGICSRNYWYWV